MDRSSREPEEQKVFAKHAQMIKALKEVIEMKNLEIAIKSGDENKVEEVKKACRKGLLVIKQCAMDPEHLFIQEEKANLKNNPVHSGTAISAEETRALAAEAALQADVSAISDEETRALAAEAAARV